MSVIEKVFSDYKGWQKKWKTDYSPPDIGFMPAGFEMQESDDKLVKSFQQLMLTLRKSRLKLGAQVSHNHEGQFVRLVKEITGEIPTSYLLEENKQSVSIVVQLGTFEAVDLNKLYTPFGGRGKWVRTDAPAELARWKINNTLFGFYLLSVGFGLGWSS